MAILESESWQMLLYVLSPMKCHPHFGEQDGSGLTSLDQSCAGSTSFSIVSAHCWCPCLGVGHQEGTERFSGGGRFVMAPQEGEPSSQ